MSPELPCPRNSHQDLRIRALKCDGKNCSVKIELYKVDDAKYHVVNQYKCFTYKGAKFGDTSDWIFDDITCVYNDASILVINKTHVVPTSILIDEGYIIDRSTGEYTGYSNYTYTDNGFKMMSSFSGNCAKGADLETIKKF